MAIIKWEIIGVIYTIVTCLMVKSWHLAVEGDDKCGVYPKWLRGFCVG